jgi:hypothetical protein
VLWGSPLNVVPRINVVKSSSGEAERDVVEYKSRSSSWVDEAAGRKNRKSAGLEGRQYLTEGAVSQQIYAFDVACIGVVVYIEAKEDYEFFRVVVDHRV